MSGHVTVRDGHFRPQKTTEIRSLIHDRFGIHHSTIQLELDGRECEAGTKKLEAYV
jgi:Co/Zn/Cd efflux system component